MTKSTPPWHRRIARAFSTNEDALDSLTWFTTYLTSVSQAEPERARLLEMASAYPEPVARPWRRALGLVENLGFDHASSIRSSAGFATSPAAEALMERFGQSVLAGTPATQFFERSRRELAAQYFNYYERCLGNLEKWMGGYSATAVSVVMVIAVSMVVALVYEMPAYLLTNLSSAAVGATILGTYSLGRSSPVEARWLATTAVPLQVRLKQVWPFAVGAGIVCGALAARAFGLGGFLVAFGLCCLPIGIFSLWAERQITLMEQSLPDLIRRACGLAEMQRSTLSAAVQELPASGFGELSVVVQRLQCRLYYQLGEALCWEMLTRETGSSLVQRAVRTLTDALRQGAPPAAAGETCRAMVERMVALRERRASVADPFVGVMVALNAVLTAVLWLMLETTEFFGGQFRALSEEVLTGFPTDVGIVPTLFLHFPDVQAFRLIATMLVIVLAVSMSIACVWIRGSHWLSGFYYLGLMLCVAGIILIGVPMIAKSLYGFEMTAPAGTLPDVEGGG